MPAPGHGSLYIASVCQVLVEKLCSKATYIMTAVALYSIGRQMEHGAWRLLYVERRQVCTQEDIDLSIHCIGIKSPVESRLTPAARPKSIPHFFDLGSFQTTVLPKTSFLCIDRNSLDKGQLGGGNVESINVSSQASVGLLGAVGAAAACQ